MSVTLTHEIQEASVPAVPGAAALPAGVDLGEVRKHYVFPKDGSVEYFLAEHSSLVPLLLEAVGPLRTCFGADAMLELQVDESDWGIVYGVVKWPGEAGAVREALDRFDRTWWMGKSIQGRGFLEFTYHLI